MVSTYNLKTLVTVSVVQLRCSSWILVQLARWIDSTVLDALYGWGWGWNRPHTNFDPVMGLNNAFGDMLLNFVMATMFIVLPLFWVTALGWAATPWEACCKGLLLVRQAPSGRRQAADMAFGGAMKWASTPSKKK